MQQSACVQACDAFASDLPMPGTNAYGSCLNTVAQGILHVVSLLDQLAIKGLAAKKECAQICLNTTVCMWMFPHHRPKAFKLL